MQTLIRVGCCAQMRRGMPCRTFRGWHATRRVASIGQREVQFQADGGCAAWRAETMQIVCDFSAADDFCRDAHIDIRRESQRQTRPRRRSKLHVAAQTRTDACRQVVACVYTWTAVLALSLRSRLGRTPQPSAHEGWRRRGRARGVAPGGGTQMPQCRFRPLGRLNTTALGSDGQGPSTRAAMRFTPATVT